MRIGVTGHRVLSEREKIERAVDAAAARIAEAWPGERWTVVSGLAEGADRLVALRLLERTATRLVAVLPLPADDYETDFASAASRDEFRALLERADEVVEVPPAASRTAAYEAAGAVVVDGADVLVAVWDGRRAQDRGGTGAIVERGRERGLPLVWVHAGNRRPGTLEPTSLGTEQGAVTFERLDGPHVDSKRWATRTK